MLKYREKKEIGKNLYLRDNLFKIKCLWHRTNIFIKCIETINNIVNDIIVKLEYLLELDVIFRDF